MIEPTIIWYWESHMIDQDERGFFWAPTSVHSEAFAVKCKARGLRGLRADWNVCRVEFDPSTNITQLQQTMNTLLDVCRMRYADELLNQGEMK